MILRLALAAAVAVGLTGLAAATPLAPAATAVSSENLVEKAGTHHWRRGHGRRVGWHRHGRVHAYRPARTHVYRHRPVRAYSYRVRRPVYAAPYYHRRVVRVRRPVYAAPVYRRVVHVAPYRYRVRRPVVYYAPRYRVVRPVYAAPYRYRRVVRVAPRYRPVYAAPYRAYRPARVHYGRAYPGRRVGWHRHGRFYRY